LTVNKKNTIIVCKGMNDGHVIGFLGDGINDAPSLKTSDVGISVDNAVDVAKESGGHHTCVRSLLVNRMDALRGNIYPDCTLVLV